MNRILGLLLLTLTFVPNESWPQSASKDNTPALAPLPENCQIELKFEPLKPKDPGSTAPQGAEPVEVTISHSGPLEKQLIKWNNGTEWTVYFASGYQLWKSLTNGTVTVLGSPGALVNNSQIPCSGLYQTAWIKPEHYQGVKTFEGKSCYYFSEKEPLQTRSSPTGTATIQLPPSQATGRIAYLATDTLLPVAISDATFMIRFSLKPSTEKVILPPEYQESWTDFRRQIDALARMKIP